MSILSEAAKFLFGKSSQNIGQRSMDTLNRIPGMEQKAFGPYEQRGAQAGETLSPIFQEMAKDPAAYYEQLMSGYEPSKAYQLRSEEARNIAANAAAAGGYRGAPGDIQAEQRITDKLLGEDMQQYFSNLMGLGSQGLAGEQNLYQTGLGATSKRAGDMANVLGQQSQIEMYQDREKQAQQQSILNALLGLGVRGFDAYNRPNNSQFL